MKGTILSTSVISGDDGNRYNFSNDDIKNAGGSDISALIGAIVDFEIEDKSAKAIFIIKKPIIPANINLNIDNIKEMLLSNNLQDIRTKGFLSVGCLFVAFIFFYIPPISIIGYIFLFMCTAFLTLAAWGLNHEAKSSTLFKNYIIALTCTVLGFIVVNVLQGLLMQESLGSPNTQLYFGLIFFVSYLPMLYFDWRFFTELSFITQQKYFIYLYYLGLIFFILASLCAAFVRNYEILMFMSYIGHIQNLALVVLQGLGWYKFSEIRLSNQVT